jgi:4-hydroxy-tetrahydrodipicolinate reductase
MTNIILVGSCGRMGKKVIDAIEASEDFNLVFGADPSLKTSLSDCDVKGDFLIDFSTHTTAFEIANFIEKNRIPAVIATTGHTKEEIDAIKKASEVSPIFFAGNMSIGVGLTAKLACQVAKTFKDADCEIVETHHNKKIDSPSGTALMIANAILKERGFGKIVTNRDGFSKREAGDVGISSIRRGNVVGEHSVIFDTGTQSIEIKHTSQDRMLFAEGALNATKFLEGKEKGLYDMEDLLCE